MTIHLPEELESSILAAVHGGRFDSIDDAMAEAVRLLLRDLKDRPAPPASADGGGTAPGQGQKPVWERILEMTADIPDEEWDKLPTDLSEQHDHYIYGTPRRPPAR